MKTATNPESGVIGYTYDNNGNLMSKTDARSITTSYSYDNLNRVKIRSYSDSTLPVTYTYDNLPNAKGKLIKVATTLSETRYLAFDILGRVTSSQQVTDNVTYNPQSYVYNLSGALLEETYPSGRVVKNTLDQDGNLAQVQSAKANGTFQNYANSFNYTAAGAVSSMRLGNGRWENTQFNARLQPTQIGLGGSATSQNLLKLNYEYGATASVNNGNITKQTISVPTETRNNVTYAAFTAIQTYTYDSLNRINDAKEMIGSTQEWKQTFQYDRFGNRRFDTSNGNTTTLIANCETPICNPEINVANNRLIGTTFDNAGNTTVDASGQTFVYDAENKQVQVTNAGGINKYFYDGDGKRVKKIVPASGETTIFVYDASGKMVAEYSTVTANTPQISYLTNDTLGSPRITTDANGAVISRRDFMPFGEEITIGRTGYGTDSVRQKFTSYQRDNETDLDFAQARMYDKNHGRFTTTDPLLSSGKPTAPQTWNRFSYTINNPLKFIDPKGLCTAPTGLQQGQVGICFEAFIATPRVGPGGVGHGDGRTFSKDDGSFTARVTVSVIISTDENNLNVMKSENINTSDAGVNMSGPVGVGLPNTSGERVARLQGTATTDVKFSNNDTALGEKDFGKGVDVTVSIADGANGGQQVGKNTQSIGETVGSIPLIIAGNLIQAAAPKGTIDGSVTLRITGSGNVTGVSANGRPFPSYAAYSYTKDADGNIHTTTHVEQPETPPVENLTKPVQPFPIIH